MLLQVRAAVCELLSAWAAAAPLEGLLEELADGLLSAKCTADGRAAGLMWLAGQACGAGGRAALAGGCGQAPVA